MMLDVGRVTWASARRLLQTVLMALMLSSVSATVASAHAALKSSTPAANARLDVVPRELRLDFTEAPALAVTRLRLLDAAGKIISLSPIRTASESKRTVIADITGTLMPGTYTVEWQITGDDGHPIRGQYKFTIAAGATASVAVTSGPENSGTAPVVAMPDMGTQTHHDSLAMPGGPGFNAESPAYVAVRAILFLGLLMAVGAVAFRELVLRLLQQPPEQETLRRFETGAAGIGLLGAATVAVGALLRLWAQSYALLSPGDDILDLSRLWPMLSSTVWGRGWLLQIVAALIAINGFYRISRGLPGRVRAFVGVLLLAFTPALSGHAASAPDYTALAILADGLHVIGAGGWLGSLLVVVAVALPIVVRPTEEGRNTSLQDLFSSFSRTALIFSSILVTTGVFAAWLHMERLSALWESSYGQTLLVKLGLFSLVAGTGAYNWLRVRPALAAPSGSAKMRKSARIELAVAVLVIIVTAVLVATPTPMDQASM